MNKTAAALFAFVFLIAAFVINLLVGSLRDQIVVQEAQTNFEYQTSKYLEQVTEDLRNDLLQDSFRVVRNRLSSLASDVLFSAYKITKNGLAVDESQNFEKIRDRNDYLHTTVRVDFSKGQNSSWGEVEYLTSKVQIYNLASSLRSSLLVTTFLSSIVIASIIILLLILYWTSGVYLTRFIDAKIRKNPLPSNKLILWIWHPLLNLTSKMIEEGHALSDDLALAKIDQEISNLAKQVSHDIRSPLSALNILLERSREFEDSEKNLLQGAISRINRIANDLLKYEKSTNGEIKTVDIRTKSGRKDSVDLRSLISAICDEKKIILGENSKIELSLDVAPNCNSRVQISELTLERILSNLINNAIESIENKGKVTIALREYGKIVNISVLDTGKGIPSEILDRLGKEHLSHGKSDAESGSGIGVFHAYKEIEKYGGKISIQSQVGQGTCVAISLNKDEVLT